MLEELGRRVRQQRITLELTQAGLAEESGVPLRAVERLEAGESIALEKFIRVLRALRLVWNLEQLIPPAGPTPIQQLGSRVIGQRRRASAKRKQVAAKQSFTWGDRK